MATKEELVIFAIKVGSMKMFKFLLSKFGDNFLSRYIDQDLDFLMEKSLKHGHLDMSLYLKQLDEKLLNRKYDFGIGDAENALGSGNLELIIYFIEELKLIGSVFVGRNIVDYFMELYEIDNVELLKYLMNKFNQVPSRESIIFRGRFIHSYYTHGKIIVYSIKQNYIDVISLLENIARGTFIPLNFEFLISEFDVPSRTILSLIVDLPYTEVAKFAIKHINEGYLIPEDVVDISLFLNTTALLNIILEINPVVGNKLLQIYTPKSQQLQYQYP